MRRDYRAFGDCFSCDTTYRTNKHHRPLDIQNRYSQTNAQQ
ncbi:hypothetical protein LINPERHAP1_LOCUS36607 [Linum perenne]